MNVLLLEDDLVLSKEIKEFLTQKKIICDVVFDGEVFFRQNKLKHYDIYLLDINVPKQNGIEVCKNIRETDKSTPILMLTAFGEIEDKMDAFKYGADDYLVKPFHLEELWMRIQSLYRRKSSIQESKEIFYIDDLSIDIEEQKVCRNEQAINLTPKEYKLLVILAKANGSLVSKSKIAEILWDYHIETNQNTIEVYINFLRNKIDKNHPNKLIHTKVGFGYYLKKE